MVEGLEERWERWVPAYLDVAGVREEKVASATRWWHRLAEYQGIGELADGIEGEIAFVWSDDYGLASQLALEIAKTSPTGFPRLVLPFDPLHARRAIEPSDGERGVVLLARRAWLRGDDVVERTWSVPHPTTGEAVQLALIRAREIEKSP